MTSMKDALIKAAKGKVVHAIAWNDAHGSLAQVAAEDIEHSPWQFITVGIIVEEDEQGISLVQEVDEAGEYRNPSFIPAQMVVAKWRLRSLAPPPKAQLK